MHKKRVYHINIGFAELIYHPKKSFVYIFYFRNQTYSGLISLPFGLFKDLFLKRVLALTCLVCAILLTNYFSFGSNGQLTVHEGIGGVGVLHDLREVPTNWDKKDWEESETLKDQLLATDEEQTVTSRQQKQEYIVKSGDSLSVIAKRFGVSVESIAGSSGIRSVDSLQIGKKLIIPNRDGFFYTLKKNDRIANILSKYKVNFDEFFQENSNLTMDIIEVGQEIFLPGAKPNNLIRGWLVPVSSRIVTSSYGWRKWPRKAFHKGLDLKAPYVPVRAAKNGRVQFAGWLGGYGKCVIIQHSGGYKSLYGHLSRIYVRKGMGLTQGRVIGRSGNTGYSFGPHLHFEVVKNGRHINPKSVLRGLRWRRR